METDVKILISCQLTVDDLVSSKPGLYQEIRKLGFNVISSQPLKVEKHSASRHDINKFFDSLEKHAKRIVDTPDSTVGSKPSESCNVQPVDLTVVSSADSSAHNLTLTTCRNTGLISGSREKDVICSSDLIRVQTAEASSNVRPVVAPKPAARKVYFDKRQNSGNCKHLENRSELSETRDNANNRSNESTNRPTDTLCHVITEDSISSDNVSTNLQNTRNNMNIGSSRMKKVQDMVSSFEVAHSTGARPKIPPPGVLTKRGYVTKMQIKTHVPGALPRPVSTLVSINGEVGGCERENQNQTFQTAGEASGELNSEIREDKISKSSDFDEQANSLVTENCQRKLEGQTGMKKTGLLSNRVDVFGANFRRQNIYYGHFSELKIHIDTGDITNLKVQAIVSPANRKLKPCNSAALAIARAAGTQPQVECQSFLQNGQTVNVTSVFVTPGGHLHARFVLHAVSPKWKGGEYPKLHLDHLRRTVLCCLLEAVRLGVSSVAIPSISTVSKELCSVSYMEAVKHFDEFMKDEVGQLCDVYLVDDNTALVNCLKQKFCEKWLIPCDCQDGEKNLDLDFAKEYLTSATTCTRNNGRPETSQQRRIIHSAIQPLPVKRGTNTTVVPTDDRNNAEKFNSTRQNLDDFFRRQHLTPNQQRQQPLPVATTSSLVKDVKASTLSSVQTTAVTPMEDGAQFCHSEPGGNLLSACRQLADTAVECTVCTESSASMLSLPCCDVTLCIDCLGPDRLCPFCRPSTESLAGVMISGAAVLLCPICSRLSTFMTTMPCCDSPLCISCIQKIHQCPFCESPFQNVLCEQYTKALTCEQDWARECKTCSQTSQPVVLLPCCAQPLCCGCISELQCCPFCCEIRDIMTRDQAGGTDQPARKAPLECPVCYEFSTSFKILRCCGAHLCSNCKPKCPNCPFCRDVLNFNIQDESEGAQSGNDGNLQLCLICERFSADLTTLRCCALPMCRQCASQMPRCKFCGAVLRSDLGQQPNGRMSAYYNSATYTPGCEWQATFYIFYSIPSNIQLAHHPHPGKLHSSAQFVAYLPADINGLAVLVLLRLAFLRRLVFKIVSTEDPNIPDRVTLGDIPHKTWLNGRGSEGYSDAAYLATTNEKLRELGVTRNSMTTEEKRDIREFIKVFLENNEFHDNHQ